MSLPDDDDALPADWTPEQLRSTVQQDFGIGADGDLPAQTRFLKNVAQLIRKRLAKNGELTASLAIFLLAPSAPAHIKADVKRKPMLDNGLTQVTGNIWFVTESVGAGQAVTLPHELDDAELFEYVTDYLDCGKAPAIIFDTRTETPLVRHYPQGLKEPDKRAAISVSSVPVTLNEIFASIDRTYKDGLANPNVQGSVGKLWKTPTKHIPVSDAEKRIQYAIKIGLANAFPTCTVREEQVVRIGRLDLELEQADPLVPASITRHAILELKVLRSHFASGLEVTAAQVEEAISDGVIQADEYRADRPANAAALCCFDMRKQDTKDACFAHAIADATARKVILRRWYIYNHTKKHRHQRAA